MLSLYNPAVPCRGGESDSLSGFNHPFYPFSLSLISFHALSHTAAGVTTEKVCMCVCVCVCVVVVACVYWEYPAARFKSPTAPAEPYTPSTHQRLHVTSVISYRSARKPWENNTKEQEQKPVRACYYFACTQHFGLITSCFRSEKNYYFYSLSPNLEIVAPLDVKLMLLKLNQQQPSITHHPVQEASNLVMLQLQCTTLRVNQLHTDTRSMKTIFLFLLFFSQAPSACRRGRWGISHRWEEFTSTSNRSPIEELRATVCAACPDLRTEEGVDEDKEQ